jgi:hypothetical protein
MRSAAIQATAIVGAWVLPATCSMTCSMTRAGLRPGINRPGRGHFTLSVGDASSVAGTGQ